MSDENSAEEPTNFPVGNRDEVPSESPEKVETPDNPGVAKVPNDMPEKDTQAAKDGRRDKSASA